MKRRVYKRTEVFLALGLIAVLSGMASCTLEPKKAANSTGNVTLTLSSSASAKLAAMTAGSKKTSGASQALVPYATYQLRYVFFLEGKYSFAYGTGIFPPYIDHSSPQPIDDAHFPNDDHGIVTGEVSYDSTAGTYVYQFVLEGVLPKKQTMCMIQVYDPALTSYYYSSGGTVYYNQVDTSFVVTLGSAYLGVDQPFDLSAGQTVAITVDTWC